MNAPVKRRRGAAKTAGAGARRRSATTGQFVPLTSVASNPFCASCERT